MVNIPWTIGCGNVALADWTSYSLKSYLTAHFLRRICRIADFWGFSRRDLSRETSSSAHSNQHVLGYA